MRILLLRLALLTAFVAVGRAIDITSPTDAYTPAAMAAGTPEGTLLLSPHEAVDLFSGNLSFAIPLLKIRGRGKAGYTAILPVGTKWNISNVPDGNTPAYNVTAGVAPADVLWPGLGPTLYTPGRVFMREVVDQSQGTMFCSGGSNTFYLGATLTRLTYVEADGSEHQLHDTLHAGSPEPTLPTGYNCSTPVNGGPSRGTVFESDDSTAMTFIADTAVVDAITTDALIKQTGHGLSGWLLFRDGTRYQTDSMGYVKLIVDASGNQTVLAACGSAFCITDSWGGTTTITSGNLGGGSATFDSIVYNGAGGAAHTITVNYDLLANHLKSGTVEPISTLFSAVNTVTTFNPMVVSSVVLPDASSYVFQYNPYGEIAQVTLPTGGVYQYDYPTTMPVGCLSQPTGCQFVYTTTDDPMGSAMERAVLRRVTARRTYASPGTLEGRTCYTPGPIATTYAITVSHLDASATDCTTGLVSQETHTFGGNPFSYTWFSPAPMPSVWYEPATIGREDQVSWANATGSALKSVSTYWQAVGPNSQDATACLVLTTLAGTTITSTSGIWELYDQYSNATDLYEYDNGSAPSPPSSCLIAVPNNWYRHTQTTYAGTPWADTPTSGTTSNHMRSLVTERDVYRSPGGTAYQAAKTTYAYDGNSLTTETGTVTGYSAPAHTKLGYLSSKNEYWSAASYMNTQYYYDNLANVLKIIDPRSKTTTIGYTDSCSALPTGVTLFAFPTKVTNALSQISNIQWDCYIGKQTQFKDANAVPVPTVYSYNNQSSGSADPFDRLTLVKRSSATIGGETHTAFLYPSLTTVTTNQDQVTLDDGAVSSTVYYDGFGRQSESNRFVDSSHCITVTQTYDSLGRLYKKSLPYNSCGGSSETKHNATTAYDGANRVLSVATDDSATTSYYYNGSSLTVTDPSTASRWTNTDGMGRLTVVFEDLLHLDYTTVYTYDVLDDLTNVAQGSLASRSFTYDWAKRLVSASNPESGTVCYGTISAACTENYDGNGNLLNRTDAKSVVTTYTYDALNRLSSKSYSDGTTPTLTNTYDSAGGSTTCPGAATVYDVGRLSSVSTAALLSVPAVVEYFNYDPLGRTCFNQETAGSSGTYALGYQYDLAGGLAAETYPSGRVMTNTFDGQNRPSSITGSPGSTYARSVTYASSDAVSQIQFGPTSASVATETTQFDEGLTTEREQPTSITVTTGSSTPLTLSYWYCPAKATTACSTNNGNVQGAGIVTPTVYGGLNLTQAFTYDAINRLASATETGGTSDWNQVYGWTAANDPSGFTEAADPYGNHWVSSGTNLSAFTPSASTNFTNNQLFIQNSAYDSNGNLKQIGGTIPSPAYSFGYDAENRQTSVVFAGATNTYLYDGQGQRVMKTTAAGSTVYVYDAAGQVAAEYATNPGTQYSTNYLIGDPLGSTRLTLNSSGAPVDYHDYLPYGEEIPSGTGGRGVGGGAGLYGSSDVLTHKFTGKERDAELAGSSMQGLDYFGARYFSGAQGRFTTPDPKQLTRRRIGDPQQWNLYPYTRNNPLKYFDPDGRELKLTIYSGTLPSNVATASANYMATTLRNAGVKNVTYDVKTGSPSLLQVIGYQLGPTPHSVLVELRPSKTGEPTIPPLESGHNSGGQAAVDTSLVTKQTNDPAQQAIGIGNLAVHEIGHEVTPFHPEGDPVMDRSADENLFNPGLNFGPGMSKLLQQKYNNSGEVEQTPPPPSLPPPPPPTQERRP